jgi:uncharacterized protein YjbI with pentapeptide repeats
MNSIHISETGLTFIAGSTIGWDSLAVFTLMIIGSVLVVFLIIGGKDWTKPYQPYIGKWLDIRKLSGLEAIILDIVLFVFAVLFSIALVATFLTVIDAATNGLRGSTPADALSIGALLVALLGAPFLLWRNVVAQETLETTQDGLVTDRINAAVASLGAEKEVNRIGRSVSYKVDAIWHTEFEWQDMRFAFPDGAIFNNDDKPADWTNIAVTVPNMEVRIGAILALGRIARENLGFHVQVMEILCAYVRENARAENATPFTVPEFMVKNEDDALTPNIIKAYKTELRAKISAFRKRLPNPRTDIQTALETIGRRTEAQKFKEGAWPNADGAADCLFDTPFPVPPAYPANDDATAHKAWSAAFATFKQDARAQRTKYILCRHYRPDLRKTNLQGHDMSGLDLRGARLNGAQMQLVVLRSAKMQGAVLSSAQMQGAILRGAQMQGANLRRVQMQGADLFVAQMQGADLSEARMQGADLSSAQMQGADLSAAQMQGADLSEAQMQGADLIGVEMQGAILDDAQMQGADLSYAQMQGADLNYAQMQGADLSEAQMSDGTNLKAASLRGAALRSVDDTTLTKLRPFWGDIFADGTAQTETADRPDHWDDAELADYLFDPANSPFRQAWRAWAATLDPPVTIAGD